MRAAGAAAISVLTEPTFFDGSLDHLRGGPSGRVDLPLLRKDFIVTRVPDRRGARRRRRRGAADRGGARRTESCAQLLAVRGRDGLAALGRGAHARRSRSGRIGAGATLVGVNSRDLRTLEVDPAVFETAAPSMPEASIAVAESGITTTADVRAARGARLRRVSDRRAVHDDGGSGRGAGEFSSRPPQSERRVVSNARQDLRHHARQDAAGGRRGRAPTRSASCSGQSSPRADRRPRRAAAHRSRRARPRDARRRVRECDLADVSPRASVAAPGSTRFSCTATKIRMPTASVRRGRDQGVSLDRTRAMCGGRARYRPR